MSLKYDRFLHSIVPSNITHVIIVDVLNLFISQNPNNNKTYMPISMFLVKLCLDIHSVFIENHNKDNHLLIDLVMKTTVDMCNINKKSTCDDIWMLKYSLFLINKMNEGVKVILSFTNPLVLTCNGQSSNTNNLKINVDTGDYDDLVAMKKLFVYRDMYGHDNSNPLNKVFILSCDKNKSNSIYDSNNGTLVLKDPFLRRKKNNRTKFNEDNLYISLRYPSSGAIETTFYLDDYTPHLHSLSFTHDANVNFYEGNRQPTNSVVWAPCEYFNCQLGNNFKLDPNSIANSFGPLRPKCRNSDISHRVNYVPKQFTKENIFFLYDIGSQVNNPSINTSAMNRHASRSLTEQNNCVSTIELMGQNAFNTYINDIEAYSNRQKNIVKNNNTLKHNIIVSVFKAFNSLFSRTT